MRSKVLYKGVAIGVLGALVCAACGDDGGESAATTQAPVSAAPATGGGAPTTIKAVKPFKVMVAGDFTSTIAYTVPETPDAVKGALKSMPSAEIITCDTKGDTNATLACSRKAVDEGVVAVINGYGGLQNDVAALVAAGIPALGNVQETTPVSFPITSALSGFTALGVGMAQAGCKKVASLYPDGGDVVGQLVKGGAEFGGAAEVAHVSVPRNAPDVAPAIARILSNKPDCIALIVTPGTVLQAMTAIDQTGVDPAPLIAGPAAVFPADTLKALGPLAEGILTTDALLNPLDPDSEVLDKIREDMGIPKGQASDKLTSIAILAWSAGNMLEAAVSTIDGDVTKESVLAALSKLDNADVGGAIHPYSSKQLTNPAFLRSFNHYAINYRYKSGTFIREGDFYDFGPALEVVKIG